MNKKGDISLSFGMIFSIIIIAATVAIAFYIIVNFLNFGKCANTGLLFNDFKDRIARAWGEDFTRDTFNGSVSSGVSYVCFGGIGQGTENANDEKIRLEISKKGSQITQNNMFTYPLGSACSDLFAATVEHMKTDSFFCTKVVNGKFGIKINKEEADALVTVSKG